MKHNFSSANQPVFSRVYTVKASLNFFLKFQKSKKKKDFSENYFHISQSRQKKKYQQKLPISKTVSLLIVGKREESELY